MKRTKWGPSKRGRSVGYCLGLSGCTQGNGRKMEGKRLVFYNGEMLFIYVKRSEFNAPEFLGIR